RLSNFRSLASMGRRSRRGFSNGIDCASAKGSELVRRRNDAEVASSTTDFAGNDRWDSDLARPRRSLARVARAWSVARGVRLPTACPMGRASDEVPHRPMAPADPRTGFHPLAGAGTPKTVAFGIWALWLA